VADEIGYETLDRSVLTRLRAFQREGGPDILGTVIKLFCSNAEARLRDLERGAESSDCELLNQASHALHSASANIGARRLARQCRQLSQSARAGSVQDATAEVRQIRAEYERLEAVLLTPSGQDIEAA
jgi:HPt (histidine-containing phosphotransfer) domain-containing protein